MSKPLAPHEIAAAKARRGPSGSSLGAVAAMGCLAWIGGSALVAWIAWSFIKVHAAVLGEQHHWWVIGASAAFVMGLSSIWSGITTSGKQTTPQTAVDGNVQVRDQPLETGHVSPPEKRDEPHTEEYLLDELAKAKGSGTTSGGNRGCSIMFGLILIAISGSILVVPILPQEQILRLSFVGDGIAAMRAERVSHYIDEKDYESVRRLGSLGLGRKTTVSALPKLSDELELVEILLMSGADPDSRDVWGDTLLMEASDPLLVDRLLAHGASPDIPNDEGEKPGASALLGWDFGVATKFVDPAGEGAPLADAIRRGDHDELARLLAEGLDPDSIVVLHGEYEYELSPLYYAAAFGDARALEMLLEAGASQDVGLMPPLVGAVESRSAEIATRLIEAGAIVDYYDRPSTDALSRAIEFDAREMVEHLVSLGAGRSIEYARLLSDTEDPKIREIVEAVMIDPAFETEN